jgi:hypothetical protein
VATRETLHLKLVAHSDLDGHGDGMQIMRHRDALYVGHHGPSGMGTSVLDVSDITQPQLVRQFPAPAGSHNHKVQVAEGLLLVNEESFGGGDEFSAGMIVYDVSEPLDPKRIGYFHSGGLGVHRIVYTGGRYAYMSAIPEGFDDRIWIVVDLSDPENPVEAGRWWWPGQWTGGGETPTWPKGKRFAAHHALLDGATAYLGYGDAGLVVLDIEDVGSPKKIGHLPWSPGGNTHTCLPLPGRGLLVATDEATSDRCAGESMYVRVIDVAEPSNPRVLSICPEPQGDYCERGMRFGPHNLHENRPGTYSSETLIFVTYFNAGLRVYDISAAHDPKEIGFWEPETPSGQEVPQINDVFVDDEFNIFVSDRITGGLYVLQPDEAMNRAMNEART